MTTHHPLNAASTKPSASARSRIASAVLLALALGVASAQSTNPVPVLDAEMEAAAMAAATANGGSTLGPMRHLPTIPLFFGEVYEGRLSPENGYNKSWHAETFSRRGWRNFNTASFEIDLLEDEGLHWGVSTDSAKGVYVSFMWQETDRKGRTYWKRWLNGVASAHIAGRNCIASATGMPKSDRYRIEIQTIEPDAVANYKFFLLPEWQEAKCDDKVDPATRAWFDRPGRPASLAIARSWQGRTRVNEAPVPAVFAPPASEDAVAYAASKPEALRPYYQALYVDGEHNAVLNFQKLGLAAMQLGQWRDAEWAFDEALSRIEAIYGRSAVAEAARSKWVGEGIKDFKGEPHERAMAYYYRGLLFLRAGDYENARSSFVAGEFQDTLSEAEQFQGDFALLNFLSGWSSQCLGDTGAADEAFAIAQQINPAIQRPTAGENTLVLADIGRGPVKMKRGQENKLLTFADSVDSGRDLQATAHRTAGKGAPLALAEYSNVYFQATTRGGRAFDAILGGKAALKSGLGNTAGVGYLLAQSGVLPLVVAGATVMAVTGLTAKNVKPDADIRMWDTLPHRVSVGLDKAVASTAYKFRFSGGTAATPATPMMRAHAGRCGIAWTRSHSVLDAPAGVPGNDADIVKARTKNKEAVARDEAFRSTLVGLPSS